MCIGCGNPWLNVNGDKKVKLKIKSKIWWSMSSK